MLSDVHLVERARRMIREEKTAAEWAVRKALDQIQAVFERIEDPYFRDRKSDIALVGERLLRNLVGHRRFRVLAEEAPKGSIAVAHELSPADAAQLGRAEAAGFCTEGGGRTSHTAIVARALGLPYVVGVEGLGHKVWSGMTVVIDGLRGEVILDPDAEALRRYEARADVHRARAQRLAAIRDVAVADHRRHAGPPARQRRDAGGDPDRRRAGRRGGRPVPHRVPLPRADRSADGGRAVRARGRRAQERRRAAGHLPHPRSRRRQAAAVGAHPERHQPGDGAALDPLLAPARGRLPDPAARALPRGGGRADADPVPADLGRRRAARGQAALRRGVRRAGARGDPPRRQGAARRHGRDSQRGDDRRSAGRGVRLPQHRHQRSHPVLAGRRPRGRARRLPLSPAASGDPARRCARSWSAPSAPASRWRCAATWRASRCWPGCCSASGCATCRWRRGRSRWSSRSSARRSSPTPSGCSRRR